MTSAKLCRHCYSDSAACQSVDCHCMCGARFSGSEDFLVDLDKYKHYQYKLNVGYEFLLKVSFFS